MVGCAAVARSDCTYERCPYERINNYLKKYKRYKPKRGDVGWLDADQEHIFIKFVKSGRTAVEVTLFAVPIKIVSIQSTKSAAAQEIMTLRIVMGT